MRQTSIDGVPVLHADGPPPVTAGLVFGVGRADESFVRGGLTHLVEHLAMSALGRQTIEANASVDLTTTEFTATGPPAQVAAFLRAVCRALTDLPTDRLAVESDVLRTESGSAAGPVVGALLGELYGMSGPGLAALREPALRSLTAADVEDWARIWFCRQNAALWLSGPAVEGITLPLLDGVAPRRTPVARLGVPTPAWGVIPLENRVALGAEMPDVPALGATLGVLRERVQEELRHRRGIAYAVEADRLPVDADARFVVLTSDVRPGQEGVVASLLWREVQRLAGEGPEPAELDHERDVLASYLDDPRAALDEVRALAQARVTGIPARTADQMRAAAAALTCESVRETAAVLAERALLTVPEPIESSPPGLARLAEWSPDVVTGREFGRKRFSGAPKGARLVVGAEGVSLVLADTERITVRWPDAVGLVRSGPGEWRLFGRDGFSLPLSADDWRDGAEAIGLVRAAVPGELDVVDDAEDGTGLLLVRAPAHKVGGAVAMSRHDVAVASHGEWTAVVVEGGSPADEVASQVVGALGRKTVGLVLRRSHADLEYVLMAGGRAIDRHRWGVVSGTPSLLAGATSRAEAELASLLAATGDPADILDRFVALLGLPPEVPDLLAGRAVPGLRRFDGLGIAGGFRAFVRGDFVPPPGTGNWLDAWQRLSATRPRWYRAVNAVGAVSSGVLLWAVVSIVGLDGGTAVPAVMCVLGLLTCLWESRPPRRPQALPEPPPARVTRSG